MALALLVTALFVFRTHTTPVERGYLLEYSVLPYLFWIAVRLDPKSAVTSTVVICTIAIWGTDGWPRPVRSRPIGA